MCTCDPSSGKAEAEGLGIQGPLQLHSEVEASLGYVSLPQKIINQNKMYLQN